MLIEKNDEVRVRFAPSPTGYLHIGGARTAIFNWLYARQRHGKFLLRIEDTDAVRSNKIMVTAIFDGLKWLGIDWDEEPVFQSHRFENYQKICRDLVASGKAYHCYCTREELAARHRDAFKYDGFCRNLTAEEIEKHERENRPYVVRFKVQAGKTFFNDIVRGSLTFDNDEIDDFIILRSDLKPTYHLAVVADDFDMRISHVIRGDDHLTNTPKQVLLYQALGWPLPKFAHVPLILGADRKRLSKRHGATAISEYRTAGYLSEVMVNFLALLGWSPKANQEILPRQKLIEKFSLKAISRNSAIFDEAKLNWMNGQYIGQMTDEAIFQALTPVIEKVDFLGLKRDDKNYILKIISLLKSRVKNLNEFFTLGYYFFKDPEMYEDAAVQKYWNGAASAANLVSAKSALSMLDSFDEKQIENAIRSLAENQQKQSGEFIHPIRLAITGFGVSPGLFELMACLGKDVVLRRIQRAIAWLNNKS
ncbi:MAG: glutamate--tRNA ligase [Candidatus Zhuqueibacterota bacterium]